MYDGKNRVSMVIVMQADTMRGLINNVIQCIYGGSKSLHIVKVTQL